MPRDETCSAAKPALLVLGVVRVGGKQQSTAACWVWAVREGHCCSVCPFGRKAHLAQCNRAGGQADEAPLPAVGVLGQGELLRQGLDHMLDLHGVVLGHELPDQPGERGERGCRPVESSLPPPHAGCWLQGQGCGREMTYSERGIRSPASQGGPLPGLPSTGRCGLGLGSFPYSGSRFPLCMT